MTNLAFDNLLVWAMVATVSIYTGLNPKRWQSWLLSVYSLLTFLWLGITGTGDVFKALMVGITITFGIMLAGIIKFWMKQPITKKLDKPDTEEI
jgi:hypothetical protein